MVFRRLLLNLLAMAGTTTTTTTTSPSSSSSPLGVVVGDGGDSLTFISEICGALKTIKRAGWLRRQIPFPESDADHMHRCAMCALLLSQPADPRDNYKDDDDGDGDSTNHKDPTRTGGGVQPRLRRSQFHPSVIDTTRLLRMTVTHDLCEALAGDVTPFCNPTLLAAKQEKEEQAMNEIRKVVGDPLGKELFELWREYEEQQTPEAIYAKDIDKFEMVVQAHEYEKMHLLPRKNHNHYSQQEEESSNTKISSFQNNANGVVETATTTTTATTTAAAPTTTTMTPTDGVPTVFCEPLRTFFITTNSVMKTPLFRRLDRELRERREILLKERGWEVTDKERQQESQGE